MQLVLAHRAEGARRAADGEGRVRGGNPLSHWFVSPHRQTVRAQPEKAASASAEHKTPCRDEDDIEHFLPAVWRSCQEYDSANR
jgi:hypothetical protein